MCYAQNGLTEDELIVQIEELYQKEFTNRQNNNEPLVSLQIYLEQIDYIKLLKKRPGKKLTFLSGKIGEFRALNLHREAVNAGRSFVRIYEKHKDSLLMVDFKGWKFRSSYEYQRVAHSYNKLSNIDSAEIFLVKTIEEADREDFALYASYINNYGLFLLNDKRLPNSALKTFETATKIIDSNDAFNNHLYGSIVDNIADVHLTIGDIEKARNLYYQNYFFYKRILMPGREIIDANRLYSAGAQFITTSVALGNLSKVEEVYSELKDFNKNNINIPTDILNTLDFLKAEEKYLLFTGKAREAALISDKIVLITDSIESSQSVQRELYAGMINDHTVKQLRTNFLLEKSKQNSVLKNNRLTLWIISLVALILIGILVFIGYRKQKKILSVRNNEILVQRNLEISNLKNQHLSRELDLKTKDLADFAIQLNYNQEWATDLAKHIESIKNCTGRERGKKMHEVEQEILNKIKYDSNSKIFFERLDKLSASFYKRLTDRYPKLSKTDRRLCSLIRLKMDNNAIASLHNISVSSLHTSRYRLRKKLNLSTDQDLNQFILEL